MGWKKAIFKWDGLIRVCLCLVNTNLNPTVFRYFTKGSEFMFKSSSWFSISINLVFFTELAHCSALGWFGLEVAMFVHCPLFMWFLGLGTRSLNFSVAANVFPMLAEKPYFEEIINPKTYLKHKLGSKFLFLSSLAYELVNILDFEKISCKISKNHFFF